MTNVELLYDMIWTFIDVNPLTLGEIVGVFEEIKYELIRDAKKEYEENDEREED